MAKIWTMIVMMTWVFEKMDRFNNSNHQPTSTKRPAWARDRDYTSSPAPQLLPIRSATRVEVEKCLNFYRASIRGSSSILNAKSEI